MICNNKFLVYSIEQLDKTFKHLQSFVSEKLLEYSDDLKSRAEVYTPIYIHNPYIHVHVHVYVYIVAYPDKTA